MQNRIFIASVVFISLIIVACQPSVETGDAAPTPEALPAESDSAEESVEMAEPTSPLPTPTEDVNFPVTSTPIPADSDSQEDPDMSIFRNQPKVAQALEDLSGRLNVTADEIQIVAVEAKTWPDSSMGCPQEGMMYMQVLVEDGMLIQLEMDGKIYNYHSGPTREPFLCENK